MTGLNAGHVGIAGEVRCVVKREDGSIKEDTGFQKNLILNQGLDFFGGDKGVSMFQRCAIGSGNTPPAVTQTLLNSFLSITTGGKDSTTYDYAPSSSNLYKTSTTYKYTFTGLDNKNVSEVGLVSQGSTSADYYLCTRALLKDSLGAPTTITILLGETLDVYYRLWRVVSTLDAAHVVNMLDGKGGSISYNCSVRPAFVGTSAWDNIGSALTANDQAQYSSNDYLGINAGLSGASSSSNIATLSAYIKGSYKRKLTLNLPTSVIQNIRSVMLANGVGLLGNNLEIVKFRFGSVSDDSPIAKTGLQTLMMPFEFSWGRYEGAL